LKREPVGDIDIAVLDSLKVLDPGRPIREGDILIVIEIKTLSRIRLLTKVLWVSEVVSSLERADQLRNCREAGVGLLPLQTHQRGAMLPIGEPDFNQAVADECRAHDGDNNATYFQNNMPCSTRPTNDRVPLKVNLCVK